MTFLADLGNSLQSSFFFVFGFAVVEYIRTSFSLYCKHGLSFSRCAKDLTLDSQIGAPYVSF